MRVSTLSVLTTGSWANAQKKMDEFIQFAMGAATQAVLDAGIDALSEEEKLRTGVLIGSGIGGLSLIEETVLMMKEKGPKRVSPFFIPACLINLASGQVSIMHGFKGPNHSVVTACSTGAHALGDATRFIQHGDADMMVAGSAEATICRIGLAGFAACRALSTAYNDTPQKASRPWDRGPRRVCDGRRCWRCGARGIREHAKKRGAKIYAEVVGYGLSGDAYHMTAPSPEGDGGFRAMQAALSNAKLSPGDIDYINAHGTSTPLSDEIELGAVKTPVRRGGLQALHVVDQIGHWASARRCRLGRRNLFDPLYRQQHRSADAQSRRSLRRSRHRSRSAESEKAHRGRRALQLLRLRRHECEPDLQAGVMALPCQQPEVIRYSTLLAFSFRHWLGRDLLLSSGPELAEPTIGPSRLPQGGSPYNSPSVNSGDDELTYALYHAPFALVSHGTQGDPIFRYANLAAQALWGYSWEEFTQLPSRLSAEPMAREERQRLLERAAKFGYVDDYHGIRIAKDGRRFNIRDTILWNVVDEMGMKHGQAAMFDAWNFL